MNNNLFGRLAQAAVVVLGLGASIEESNAGSFTRGCAWRDRQILMLIEQGEQADVARERQMTEAIQRMLYARIVCYDGHVVDALKIYDTIGETFTSDPFTSAPIN